MIASKNMTEEEKVMRLNCYMDFVRSATAYVHNFNGTTHVIFLKHGEKLLKELNEQKLINKCELIRSKLVESNNYNKYLAEDILMIGCLAKR